MKKSVLIFSAIFLFCALFVRGWDDEKLFTTVSRTGVKPNVVFLVDFSRSMKEIVYHPDYDPNTLMPSNLGSASVSWMNPLSTTRFHIRWARTDSGTPRPVYWRQSDPRIVSLVNPTPAACPACPTTTSTVRTTTSSVPGPIIRSLGMFWALPGGAKKTTTSTSTSTSTTSVPAIYLPVNPDPPDQTTFRTDSNGTYIAIGDWVVVLRYVRHTDYNGYSYVTGYSGRDVCDGEPHAAGEVIDRRGPTTFTGYYGSNYYDFWIDSATRIGTFDIGTGSGMYGSQTGAPCTGCVGTSTRVIQYGDYITPVVKVLSVNNTGNYIVASKNANLYYRTGEWVCNLKGTTAGLITNIIADGSNWKIYFDEIDGEFSSTDYLWISKSVSSWVGTSAMTADQLALAKAKHHAKAVRLYGTTVKQSSVYYDQDSQNYLRWVYGAVNPTQYIPKEKSTDPSIAYQYADNDQIKQINMFHKLADDVDTNYNAKIPPPASLVAEWNTIWPQIFPTSIATVTGDHDITTTLLHYVDAKDSLALYSPGYYIKVDAEVMQVTNNDVDNKTLTVVRGQRNTYPASHRHGSNILIYKIEEYTPITHMYSSTHQIIDSTGLPNTSWTDSSGYYRYKMAFTRIQTQREALGDIALRSRDKVILGLFRFPKNTTFTDPTHYNAVMLQGLTDYSIRDKDNNLKTTYNSLNTFLDAAWGMNDPDFDTPIAIALADVWRYFKPGNSVSPDYQTGETYTPVAYNYGFELDAEGNTVPKGSPMRAWCQRNYIVMVTDGQAKGDNDLHLNTTFGVFNNQVKRDTTPVPGEYYRWNYANGWGDLDDRDPYFTAATRPTIAPDNVYCLGTTCWLLESLPENDKYSGSDYADDVAYFMYHQDMFPTRDASGNLAYYDETNDDPALVWKGDQRIYTYTIGLTIQNDLLSETAQNGNGLNFTVSNYADTADSFAAVIENIMLREEPMMYTTYAAPKQSVTEGRYGYVSNFVPRNANSIWEGHLKRFRLGDDGNFPAAVDVLDKTNRGQVLVDGAYVPSFLWDVYDTFMSRTVESRTIYTSKAGNRELFTEANATITNSDLDVSDSALRNYVIDFIRGNYGTGYTWKYGDTFHFNPLVVGAPIKWKAQFDTFSYGQFYKYYAVTNPREEAIYVGANDGMLHCFRASDGYELWGFIPPSQLKMLKYPALNPHETRSHNYYVDGKAMVRDIKVANTGTYEDWKTILVTGMGAGGKTYLCMDITNPADPQMLWEFSDPIMGHTESKPIIVDMYDGSETFPAVVLAGGYNIQEVPADSTDGSIPAEIKREGKAIFIVRAETGEVVKRFIYDASSTNTNVAYTSPDLKYPFTASPVLYDSNNDGLADYLYAADTGNYRISALRGGAVWKIPVYGNPSGWVPQKIYQGDDGQTIFLAPTIVLDQNYRVWIMFGTGRRSKPVSADTDGNFDNLTGQFVAFIDDTVSASAYPLTNSQLTDVTASVIAETSYSFSLTASNRGLYTGLVKADHEIIFEPQPLFINGRIYFTTFSPLGTGGTGSVDDICAGSSNSSGEHFTYKLGISSSGNSVDLVTPTVTREKILGYGVLSGNKYKIYFGQGAVGSFSVTPGPWIDMDNIFGPLFWKENNK